MADRPLVSIVTPTYRRHALLLEAIENVKAQDYDGPIEHIVVADGPDPDLRRALWASGNRPADPFTCGGTTNLQLIELGRHWTGLLDESYAAAPMIVAQFVAAGEFCSLLGDDERMHPSYIRRMVDELERTGADFVYPRVAYYRWFDTAAAIGIGSDPPQLGGITTLVYRASAVNKAQGPYRTHTGRANDWDFVKRLMDGGATWSFVDEVLFSHRDDRDCPPDLYPAPLPAAATP